MHKPDSNNLIAIASGKGGVGKTWLSITLAHLIARSGRKILLFDGDIGLANVDVQLGITPERDLGSVVQGRCSLRDAIYSYDQGNFDIIAGRSGSATLASLPADSLQNITKQLKELQREYEVILLDLGAGVEQDVRYLATIAGRCAVVLTDEPTSLTDAYAFIKLCRQGGQKHLDVIINQTSTQKEGEQTYNTINKACVNFLQFSPNLLGIIRRDNKVRDAIRHQDLLTIRSPHATAASDVAKLAIKLMQK